MSFHACEPTEVRFGLSDLNPIRQWVQWSMPACSFGTVWTLPTDLHYNQLSTAADFKV